MKTKKPNRFQEGVVRMLGIDRYLDQWQRNQEFMDLKVFARDKHEEVENKVWFDGRADKIEHFFKTMLNNSSYMSQNKFWRSVNTNMPKLHMPLPSMISRAMGTLLFNQEINCVVDAGSKGRNKELQKRLDEIIDTNDLLVLLQDAAVVQSYSGAVGFKWNFDSTISNEPLITTYPKEKIKIERKYNQIVYVDFIDHLENGYKLQSRYGLGYINYSLYDKDNNKVSLQECPETSELQDIAFFDINGDIIPVMFAGVVFNKGNKAESDYKGLSDTFQAIDEAYSSLINYIRKSKPKTYLTEDLMEKDASGRIIPRSDFDDTIVKLDQIISENANGTKIERDIIKLEVDGYWSTIKGLRQIALEKIGLSPATIGIDGGGANQSGEALNIRERSSGRLRDEKLANWKEQLDNILYAGLMFDYLLENGDEIDNGLYVATLPHEFTVNTDFGSFTKESLQDRINTYLPLFEKGLIAKRFTLEKIFNGELNDVEIDNIMEETENNNKTL